MIRIRKTEGTFKTCYTLIDDATGSNVGLAKGKNWLIKRNAWNYCNNVNYLTNDKIQVIIIKLQSVGFLIMILKTLWTKQTKT